MMACKPRAANLLLLSVFLFFYGLQGPADAAERVLTLTSERGAKFRLLLTGNPETAKANLILLPGGDGRVLLSGKGSMKRMRKNFLVRTRSLFAAQGFLTAVMDAPRDRQKQPGLLGGFRASLEHAGDMAKAAAAMNALNGKPVIVVGTSRGTISAANLAARHEPGTVQAAVLTSSLVHSNRKGSWIQQLPLDDIKIPTLFVHNDRDICRFTLLSDLEPVVEGMKDAGVAVELVTVTSTRKKEPNDCKPMTPHGFLGIEAKVVNKIAEWIKGRL